MPTSVAELQALLQAERASSAKRIAELEKERDNLRASHERLRQELELMKLRIFVAKAERVDTKQLELEFADKLRELERLAGTLGIAQERPASDDRPARDGKRNGRRTNNRGTGRRDLRELPLDEKRIEIVDPHLEALVATGTVVRHGFDETCKLGHRRASKVRVVIARVRYKTVDADGNADVICASMPQEMLPASIAAPSLAAHVIMENVGRGLPLFRIEDSFARDGVPIDRGTLSRWKKTVGESCAQTVARAMHEHARTTAFCISTDATGICVQPLPSPDKGRQACKKGHFLVMIADRDHILFEYLEKETSAAIYARFRGFNGYVQSDAKSVFNLLFAEHVASDNKHGVDPDGCIRSEVGCWYHCRRKFWEAAATKNVVAREGLMRIGRIFELDASWAKKPPSEIKRLREQHLRPHVASFFAWVDEQRTRFRGQRGYLRTALEYAHNQRDALTRFFEDGRLVLSSRVGDRRGGVQERPICFRPFRLAVPHSSLHHSVSGPRHIKPDRRFSRIRLTARVSSIEVMCLLRPGLLSPGGSGFGSHQRDPRFHTPPRYSTASSRSPFALAS
jgi:transposase